MQQQLNYYIKLHSCYPSSTSAAVDQETTKPILKSLTTMYVIKLLNFSAK